MNLKSPRLRRPGAPIAAAAVVGLGIVLVPTAAYASPAHGIPSSTTLDACGYFVGVQTPSFTHTDGTTTIQRGTWTGVTNNYVDTAVASLGKVQGAFYEITTPYGADGRDTEGTESFTSNAGQIYQSFSYGPDVPGGFSVSVTATRDLSFLTSSTNGDCYTGSFPRP